MLMRSLARLGAIKEPSYYYKDPLNQSNAPPAQLNLDFIFGYKSNHCRSNLKFLKNGTIVYHTAAIGIVMDYTSQKNPFQRFFEQHTEEITW